MIETMKESLQLFRSRRLVASFRMKELKRRSTNFTHEAQLTVAHCLINNPDDVVGVI